MWNWFGFTSSVQKQNPIYPHWHYDMNPQKQKQKRWSRRYCRTQKGTTEASPFSKPKQYSIHSFFFGHWISFDTSIIPNCICQRNPWKNIHFTVPVFAGGPSVHRLFCFYVFIINIKNRERINILKKRSMYLFYYSCFAFDSLSDRKRISRILGYQHFHGITYAWQLFDTYNKKKKNVPLSSIWVVLKEILVFIFHTAYINPHHTLSHT